MSHFNSEFIRFFRELDKNNSTAWFDANRKTYESQVKKPFQLFVENMIGRMQEHDPKLNIKASDCIFRINKDIRFSKEKIPYNTHVAANISPFGRKSKEYPGLYFQFGAEKIMIVGGAYMLKKDNLQKLRSTIAADPGEFESLISAAPFKEKFGVIQGEKSKILPAELKAAAAKQPLIANKSFYFAAEPGPEHLLSPALPDTIMEYYFAAKPVNEYLRRVMEQPAP